MEQASKREAGFGTIFRLQQRALVSLQIAIDEVTQMASSVYGRNRALVSVQKVHATLESIDLNYYLRQKKARRPTKESFDRPVHECLTLLNSKRGANLPFDVNCMRKSLDARPDDESLSHFSVFILTLRHSYRDIRLLRSRLLRILMSGWTVAGIFAFAALYAIGYFAFVKSGVNYPISDEGARQVVASAQIHVNDITAKIRHSRDALEAAKVLSEKVIDLVSKVPPVLLAISVIYPAFRKVFIISNIRA